MESRHGDGVYLVRPPEELVPSLADELLKSHSQLPAIMEVREALETQTARLAARRRTDSDLHEMREVLREMTLALDLGEESAPADRRFHAAIAQASRNDLLINVYDQLADLIDQTRRASLSRPGRPPRSLMAHDKILHAIDQRDEEGAAQAMRDHLRIVSDVAFVPHESRDKPHSFR